MTLPDKPVPRDIYDVAVRLVAKRLPISHAGRRAMREWAGHPDIKDRELAAKVVIHAATIGKIDTHLD